MPGSLRLTHAGPPPFSCGVAGKILRIFSDIHYGDHASQVDRLEQLHPLLKGVDQVVLNGDTVDTREGPRPDYTAACREEVQAFAANGPGVLLLSGNHDPDLTQQHHVALAGGQVVVTHGDIFFDNIVPWGLDRHMIRTRIAAALAQPPHFGRVNLEERFAIWRRVAASMRQRHQSERNPLKYAFLFALDTVWPPLRVFRILRTWKVAPRVASQFAREHWPAARFIVVGHTHRAGVWSFPDGPVVINTGSFCPPGGGLTVDVEAAVLRVRRLQRVEGEFRPGAVVAEFLL